MCFRFRLGISPCIFGSVGRTACTYFGAGDHHSCCAVLKGGVAVGCQDYDVVESIVVQSRVDFSEIFIVPYILLMSDAFPPSLVVFLTPTSIALCGSAVWSSSRFTLIVQLLSSTKKKNLVIFLATSSAFFSHINHKDSSLAEHVRLQSTVSFWWSRLSCPFLHR